MAVGILYSCKLAFLTWPSSISSDSMSVYPSPCETAPSIWDCTRFCLDDRILSRGNQAVYFASAVLIAALGDLAIKAGIESILGNFDSAMLRLYRRIGCEVDVLGSTQRHGQPIYLGLFPISEPMLRRVKGKLTNAQSLIEKSTQGELLVA